MSIIRRSSVFDPFALEPFEALASLSAPRSNYAADVSAFANTCIDWKETPEAHVFKADLPGLRREEVTVEVEGGSVLQISGERKREDEQNDDRWHRVERSSGKFLRRFRLPDNAKPDLVTASMVNGVLTVMVPKEELKNSEVKPIPISGDGN